MRMLRRRRSRETFIRVCPVKVKYDLKIEEKRRKRREMMRMRRGKKLFCRSRK